MYANSKLCDASKSFLHRFEFHFIQIAEFSLESVVSFELETIFVELVAEADHDLQQESLVLEPKPNLDDTAYISPVSFDSKPLVDVANQHPAQFIFDSFESQVCSKTQCTFQFETTTFLVML